MRSAGGQNLEQISWANISMFMAVLRRLTEPVILRALATPCKGKQSFLHLSNRTPLPWINSEHICQCFTQVMHLQDKILVVKVWGACSAYRSTLLCWRHTSPHTAVLVRFSHTLMQALQYWHFSLL